MLSTQPPARANRLLGRIRKDVVRTRETDTIIADERGGEASWILDFRRIFLDPDELDALSDLFWERFAPRLPFQVGGMESASIPLITAIVLKGKARGTPVHGFYIRKSRKRIGLLKQVEGELTDEPVVLVDDLINNGNTFLKQAVLLEALGKKVEAAFAIVRFNEVGHYAALADKGIRIEALFGLEDIGLVYGKAEVPRHDRFSVRWYFRGGGADLYRVERKSTPAADATSVYYGTDNGRVYALAQKDGSERWRFKVGLRPKGSYAISDLLRIGTMLCFASRNGKVFALDADTGAVRWVYAGADWCTSPPIAAPNGTRLYVGINAGWFNKRNYLAALDAQNGAELWRIALPDSARRVTADQERISVGCADGTFLMLRAKDGSLRWSYKTRGTIVGGSARTKNGIVVFGSFDGSLYMLDGKTGELRHMLEFENGIATTPLVIGDRIIVSGLDKCVYGVSADTAEILWRFETKGRIFADPALINGHVYVGSDDSRLYELDPATGKASAFFQTVERITNPVVYAPHTGNYFLPTYAGELYCLTVKASRA